MDEIQKPQQTAMSRSIRVPLIQSKHIATEVVQVLSLSCRLPGKVHGGKNHVWAERRHDWPARRALHPGHFRCIALGSVRLESYQNDFLIFWLSRAQGVTKARSQQKLWSYRALWICDCRTRSRRPKAIWPRTQLCVRDMPSLEQGVFPFSCKRLGGCIEGGPLAGCWTMPLCRCSLQRQKGGGQSDSHTGSPKGIGGFFPWMALLNLAGCKNQTSQQMESGEAMSCACFSPLRCRVFSCWVGILQVDGAYSKTQPNKILDYSEDLSEGDKRSCGAVLGQVPLPTPITPIIAWRNTPLYTVLGTHMHADVSHHTFLVLKANDFGRAVFPPKGRWTHRDEQTPARARNGGGSTSVKATCEVCDMCSCKVPQPEEGESQPSGTSFVNPSHSR